MTMPIVDATRRDAHTAADLIATAFHALDVARWLVAHPEDRERVIYANMRIFVEHALDHGEMFLTADRSAVAVWFRRDKPLPEIADYDRRLWLACGPYTDRFRALDTAFDAHHPTDPHHHLAFMAVHPNRQGRGVGTALLNRYQARLDRAAMPAYLEASSLRSRALYARHGYILRPNAPIRLPGDGPEMWPMWRTPQTPTEPVDTT
jgi:GNAT superfamily N-acetyltransferase